MVLRQRVANISTTGNIVHEITFHCTMIICETNRLRIKNFSNEDSEFIVQLLNEPSFIAGIGEFAGLLAGNFFYPDRLVADIFSGAVEVFCIGP